MRSSLRSFRRSVQHQWQHLLAGVDLVGALLHLALWRALGLTSARRDFGPDGDGQLVPVPVRPQRPLSGRESWPRR